jgi:hypothetical protein
MKLWSDVTKAVSVSALLAVYVLALTPSARAQPTVDADAQGVLAAMSNYVGGLKSFSVGHFAVDEVITLRARNFSSFIPARSWCSGRTSCFWVAVGWAAPVSGLLQRSTLSTRLVGRDLRGSAMPS